MDEIMHVQHTHTNTPKLIVLAQHNTIISADWYYLCKFTFRDQCSGMKQHLMKRVYCSLCGLVWKQHTKSLLHNALYHCLELPCGSVPVSPLPQLFRLQSRLAPPFCLPWPWVNTQTMTRWANVSDSLCLALPHQFIWLQNTEAQGDFIISKSSTTTLRRAYFIHHTVHKPVWRYKPVQLWWSNQALECVENSNCCGSHVFDSTETPPYCFTAVVGGKYDRQIYRRDLTFNLRQKKKRERGENGFGDVLLPQPEMENKK